jgi:hypothetical protein
MGLETGHRLSRSSIASDCDIDTAISPADLRNKMTECFHVRVSPIRLHQDVPADNDHCWTLRFIGIIYVCCDRIAALNSSPSRRFV